MTKKEHNLAINRLNLERLAGRIEVLAYCIYGEEGFAITRYGDDRFVFYDMPDNFEEARPRLSDVIAGLPAYLRGKECRRPLLAQILSELTYGTTYENDDRQDNYRQDTNRVSPSVRAELRRVPSNRRREPSGLAETLAAAELYSFADGSTEYSLSASALNINASASSSS